MRTKPSEYMSGHNETSFRIVTCIALPTIDIMNIMIHIYRHTLVKNVHKKVTTRAIVCGFMKENANGVTIMISYVR